MPKRKTKADKFVGYVERTLNKNGFTLELIDDDVVEMSEGMFCSGYFDESNKLIKVATKRPANRWLGVLAHEYCHFTQCKEQCPAWTDSVVNGNDVNGFIENWLHGDDIVSYRVMCHYIWRCQQLELDNEIRTVNMIRKYSLPIPIIKYIKSACAYIHFHNVMTETRKWIRKDYKFSDDQKLLDMIPATFNQDFIDTPQNIIDHMIKYSI